MDIIKKGVDIEKILKVAIKLPVIKIDREKFLKTELKKYFSEEEIRKAIQTTPRQAGIPKEKINTIADHCINYETNMVSAISFAAGIPGGLAMLGTIPADLTQYFVYIIRIAQKLAYLYGWPEIHSVEDDLDSESSNIILEFMGIMFGVEYANSKVTQIALKMAEKAAEDTGKNLVTIIGKQVGSNAGRHIAKIIEEQVGSKVVRTILEGIEIKINQKLLGQFLSKSIPVVGGVISGGITYASYKPMCYRLKESLSKCPQAE